MGRADHPWSAAVERGLSTLPKIQLGQHAVLTLPLKRRDRARVRDRFQLFGADTGTVAGNFPKLPPEVCIYLCTFAQAAGRFARLHRGQHVVLSLPLTLRLFPRLRSRAVRPELTGDFK